jgi:hypothetical protein
MIWINGRIVFALLSCKRAIEPQIIVCVTPGQKEDCWYMNVGMQAQIEAGISSVRSPIGALPATIDRDGASVSRVGRGPQS